MEDEELNKKLWKLPENLRSRVVKGKTPISKKEGDISLYIAVALCRLPTHREMNAIADQIHSSTQYKELNRAITAYLNSNQLVKDKVCNGDIHILDLISDTKKTALSTEDKKSLTRYNDAREIQNKMNLFYKDLKFFLEGSAEDREYLRKFLKADKINYLASLLSCIRDEELLSSFIKHNRVREEL
jgi:hypothetical protein